MIGNRAVSWTIVSAIAFGFCPRLSAEPTKKPNLILAAIADGTLHTTYTNSKLSAVLDFVKLDQSSMPDNKSEPSVGLIRGAGDQLRWRIAHGLLWLAKAELDGSCETARIPLGDIDLFNRNDPKTEAIYKARYPDSRHENSHYWRFEKALNLAQGIWLDRGEWIDANQPHKPITEAYCDFLPTSPTGGLLFEARKDWCRVWKAGFTWEKQPHRTFRSWEADPLPTDPVETIEGPTRPLLKQAFARPFMVLESAGNYYFLTKDGKVFLAAKPKEGQRKVEAFWFNEDNPVFALISDADTGRQFAFTKPAPKKDTEKPICFEITGLKTEPFPVDAERIKGLDAKSPLKQARELAQILIDAKRIEVKPMTKKRLQP